MIIRMILRYLYSTKAQFGRIFKGIFSAWSDFDIMPLTCNKKAILYCFQNVTDSHILRLNIHWYFCFNIDHNLVAIASLKYDTIFGIKRRKTRKIRWYFCALAARNILPEAYDFHCLITLKVPLKDILYCCIWCLFFFWMNIINQSLCKIK